MLTNRIARFILAGMLALALTHSVRAESLPDTLAKEGVVVDQDHCIYQEKRSYCIFVVHNGESFIAVGTVQNDIFYVQRVLAVKDDKPIQVWSFNEVST